MQKSIYYVVQDRIKAKIIAWIRHCIRQSISKKRTKFRNIRQTQAKRYDAVGVSSINNVDDNNVDMDGPSAGSHDQPERKQVQSPVVEWYLGLSGG